MAHPAVEPVSAVEEWVFSGAQWLKLVLEATGAVVIGVGFLIAVTLLIVGAVRSQGSTFNRIRLVLARHLALALEFQLGADILSTAVAPTWDQIGKLAAIAIIRTGLNYFLTIEMRQEADRVATQPRSV